MYFFPYSLKLQVIFGKLLDSSRGPTAAVTFTWYNGPSITRRSFDTPLDFGVEGKKIKEQRSLFSQGKAQSQQKV
ncbi:hypothetical protein LOK49_LG02G03224 [Camellia lanceoleosa]|uniref:Uncharacterized protein n=1 Tax=Camellia lanceoleosa TaxID=1840588 RepID=A0ACC0IMA5_9ERIC|nr:hypothetical protein LOK49_LG02G03224 [Camellia lanceoleosa]